MNKRAIGTAYEKKAAVYLEEQGYRIVASNYRCRSGEIDLIAREGQYLVFLEVKYRVDLRWGSGLEAVDYRKRQRILRAARWYLYEKRLSQETACRFDVISFDGEQTLLIRNAFTY